MSSNNKIGKKKLDAMERKVNRVIKFLLWVIAISAIIIYLAMAAFN